MLVRLQCEDRSWTSPLHIIRSRPGVVSILVLTRARADCPRRDRLPIIHNVMRGQKDKGLTVEPDLTAGEKLLKAAKRITMPSAADQSLLQEIHSWGSSEITEALRRSEAKLIYADISMPTKEERDDAWYLRMLAEWIERASKQRHLRRPARVLQLKAS